MPYVIETSVRQAGHAAPVGTLTLEAARATIGRGADCSVALDDKKKYVSREHAVLDLLEGVCTLTVVSKVNPVIVNGKRLEPGASAPVKAGDVLDIGEFRLKLVEVAAVPPPPAAEPEPEEEPEEVIDITGTFDAAPAPTAKPQPKPAAPPAHDASIFDEPTYVGARPRAPEPPPAPKPQAVVAPTVEEADDAIFAEPTLVGKRPEAPAREAPKPAPDEEDEDGHESSVFAEPTFVGNTPDELVALRASLAQPKEKEAGIFDEPTLVRAPSKAPAAQKPAASAGPAAPDPAVVLRAFLEGAGLTHLKIPAGGEEAFLRESGAIVRAAIDGLVGLLLARSEMKKEMRTEERTMVSSRNNNPLKLMADPKEAITFLFEPGGRAAAGFLPPVQAVEDACDDLRAHEIALMAGLRSALLGSLKRFDPELLEKIAEQQKGAFKLNKKVKLWDTFVEHHKKLTLDAEDDFLKAFGREFLGTYQAQVNKLRKS